MPFEVVIVSKDRSFMMDPPEIEGVNVSKVINSGNEPLTSIYNSYIDRFSGDSSLEFLVFMHSDVVLDMNSLVSHIRECSGKYDVMGLCGCEKIRVSKSPLNWFTGSSDFPESRWGCVTHGELGNQTSFFSLDRKDVGDHEVACIDGLCVIISKKALETGIRFNENLKFDCYDTEFCLKAVMNFGLRIGCLVETSLVHRSVGKSILGRDFLDSEREMRKSLGLDMAPLEKALARFS